MTPDTIHPKLAAALDQRGYAELTPVQAAVVQADTFNRDLLVSARTGSGKTVAYGLALAQDVLGAGDALPAAGPPLVLVVAPTRELAQQVQRELEWLYAGAGARVVSCVGGMDPRREQRALYAGAHIVVGTPGRLRDHLERGNLQMGDLSAVVLDEADEMLDLGFREELEALLDAAPTERRTLLFSATLPKPIVAMAQRFQKNALRITVSGSGESHADIDYRAYAVAPSDVEHAVVNLLRFFEAPSALVFCSTREAVRRLHANLVERGFSVVALSGELTQNERTHALQALRDGRARVCVATDVAARGIDIPNLELVIHAELPTGAESLQHRSGRTGRAGKKGVSAILVPYPKRRRAEGLLRTAKIDPSWGPAPSLEDIRLKDQERLIEALRPAGEPSADDLAIAQALLASDSPEAVVASLVKDRRAALPSPEELVENTYQPRPEADFGSPRAPAPPRPGFEDTVWFTMDIGRTRNAEARWLLPLICRRGHITKSEIGAIRVFDRESRFEILRSVADRFTAALTSTDEDGVHIVPLADPDQPAARSRPAPHRKPPGVHGKPPHADSAERPNRPPPPAKPAYEKPAYDKAAPAKPPYAKPFAKGAAPASSDGPVKPRPPYVGKKPKGKFGGPGGGPGGFAGPKRKPRPT